MENKPEYQTKALTVAQPLTPQTWQMIMAIAEATKESHQFNTHHAEEVAIKMLVAYEHGVPLTSALSSVYVINNKPTLAPILMWAKVLVHPEFAGYEETRLEEKGAFFGWELTLKRQKPNGVTVEATRRFTMDDAQRVGLANKDNWQNYPEDVCFWRVKARTIKVVFADVSQGLYGSNELGADITPDGDVIIDTTWDVKPAELAPIPQEESGDKNRDKSGDKSQDKTLDNSFVTVGALLSLWTPDMIMNANEGKIPASEQECLDVAEKLSEGVTDA
jgi:hypothetical protein